MDEGVREKAVPMVGIEPTLPKKHDFESRASTNSATSAYGAGLLDDGEGGVKDGGDKRM